jgi:hypothetical protein
MPKKKKSVKKNSIKTKKIIPKKKKIEEIKHPIIAPIITPKVQIQEIKIPLKQDIPKKSKSRKILKIIWFSFGIIDLIWTIFWLIYSWYQKDLYNLGGIVLFAVGFYIFCFFILITLFYYIIKNAISISKKNE